MRTLLLAALTLAFAVSLDGCREMPATISSFSNSCADG